MSEALSTRLETDHFGKRLNDIVDDGSTLQWLQILDSTVRAEPGAKAQTSMTWQGEAQLASGEILPFKYHQGAPAHDTPAYEASFSEMDSKLRQKAQKDGLDVEADTMESALEKKKNGAWKEI